LKLKESINDRELKNLQEIYEKISIKNSVLINKLLENNVKDPLLKKEIQLEIDENDFFSSKNLKSDKNYMNQCQWIDEQKQYTADIEVS
jgi:hypothetical protein